jgi:hypothetical protein
MTKKEFIERIKDVPNDIPIRIWSERVWQDISFAVQFGDCFGILLTHKNAYKDETKFEGDDLEELLNPC